MIYTQWCWKTVRLNILAMMSFIAFFYLYNFDHPTELARNTYAESEKVRASAQKARDSFNSHEPIDACIVCCMDYRFNSLLADFVKEQGYKRVDWVRVAGGAKDFGNPQYGAFLEFESHVIQKYLLRQIEISIKHHHAKQVILVVHVDCLAYKGEKNASFYTAELRRVKPEVKKMLNDKGYHIPVTAYLAKFDGVSEVK